MSAPPLIDLSAGSLVLRICPHIGGTIVAFTRDAAPVLLGIPVAELSAATADRAACFPMLPFANRAPGNLLRVGDAAYRLEPNTAEPNALHGCAWQRSWTVVRQDDRTLELALDVDADTYPFAFSARQVFTLTPHGLSIAVRLTNTHGSPIPAGLGLHPYFPRASGTTLRFAAGRFWLEGPGYLPTESIKTPPELDFSWPRPLPVHWRNNCYSDWNGKAEIAQPELGYRLTITASKLFSDLMLFTPPASPIFALEPQSHTTAATDGSLLVEPARPLALLAPGESLHGDVGFVVSDYHTA